MTLGRNRRLIVHVLLPSAFALAGFGATAAVPVATLGQGWEAQVPGVVVGTGEASARGMVRGTARAQDPVSAEVYLAPAGELAVELRFAPGTLPPNALLQGLEGEDGPERFETLDGGTGLRFPPSSTPQAVEVLQRAQETLRGMQGETALLPVIVRVPAALEGADIWGLQAALSQGGIRRVRIQSGGG